MEDSLGGYCIKSKQIFLNIDTIRSVSTINTCKEYYEPHRELGKYFTIECTDGTVYNLPEDQFSKFEKFYRWIILKEILYVYTNISMEW